MPINLKQLKGEALNQLVNQGLNDAGYNNIRANFDSNGLKSISGNFNNLLKKRQRAVPSNRERSSSANPMNEKVYAPIIFPQDLDDEHYMMFHVMDRRRPSRLDVITKRALKTVVLPIPSTLTDGKGVSYNTENLTALGGAVAGRLGGAEVAGGIVDALDLVRSMNQRKVNGQSFDATRDGKGAGGANIFGAAAVTTLASTLVSKVGSGMGGAILGGLTGVAAGQKIAAATGLAEGIAVNPHTAILFDNVNFREFQFNYKFIARSQEESDTIKEIINVFQYAMHPSAAGKFAGFSYEYPEEFEIEFADAIKDYMFNINRCVLKTFNVNYNGENMPVFFEGSGAPVSVEISLGFQETTLLSKESFNKVPFELPPENNKEGLNDQGLRQDLVDDGGSGDATDAWGGGTPPA